MSSPRVIREKERLNEGSAVLVKECPLATSQEACTGCRSSAGLWWCCWASGGGRERMDGREESGQGAAAIVAVDALAVAGGEEAGVYASSDMGVVYTVSAGLSLARWETLGEQSKVQMSCRSQG